MSGTIAAVVYFRTGCPFALRLRTQLVLHRVRHIAVRFRQDEAAAVRVRRLNGGSEISPTVLVGERRLTNPSWRQVARAAAEASTSVR